MSDVPDIILSRYCNNLSGSSNSSSTNSDAKTEIIFDHLKAAALKYNIDILFKINNK